MSRTMWVAALAAATVVAALAGTANAQDYLGRSDRGRSMGSGPHFELGTEVWTDSRGVIYTDAEFNQIGATNTLDERIIEHDNVHSYAHIGSFVDLSVRMEGTMPFRVGLRLGSFIANSRSSQQMPGSFRETDDMVTRPGFAGGILADIRVPLQNGMWIEGTLDFFVGQASIDNQENTFGGTIWEGSYFFLLPELTGRFGFDIQGTGAAPFIGFAVSYYQGTVDLEDPNVTAIGSFDEIKGTINNWSYVRIVFGVEFAGAPVHTRFQIAIWNPSRDFGAAVTAAIGF